MTLPDAAVDCAREKPSELIGRHIGGVSVARRMTAGAVGVGAVAAVVVLLWRQSPRGLGDSGLTSVAVITALVALVLLVVVAVRRWRGRGTDAVRAVLACVAGLVAFLVILPSGCDDVGGVPDWERCRSYLGNPTLEWRGGSGEPWKSLYSILAPALLSTAVGVLGWRLVGPLPADKRT